MNYGPVTRLIDGRFSNEPYDYYTIVHHEDDIVIADAGGDGTYQVFLRGTAHDPIEAFTNHGGIGWRGERWVFASARSEEEGWWTGLDMQKLLRHARKLFSQPSDPFQEHFL